MTKITNLWLSRLSVQGMADRQLSVAQIRRLFHPYGWTGSNVSKWGYLADPRGSYDDALPCTFFAAINGDIVGSASLVRRDHSTLDCGPWLAGLVVRDDLKNCGIGSKLITAVIEHAVNLHRGGHPELVEGKIYLDTERTINDFDSVAMYARRGWNFLSSEYEHKQEGIVMSRAL